MISVIYNDNSAKTKPDFIWKKKIMEKTETSGTSVVLPDKEYNIDLV